MKTDPKRILIIDDDQGFRDFARDAAVTQGWVVETAANGREGCLAFANFNPDVVILDIVMPKMDGFEVLDWLSEARAQCRIILLTGYNPSYATMAEQLGEAKGLPAVTMLTKPVRLTALVAAIAA